MLCRLAINGRTGTHWVLPTSPKPEYFKSASAPDEPEKRGPGEAASSVVFLPAFNYSSNSFEKLSTENTLWSSVDTLHERQKMETTLVCAGFAYPDSY